MEEKNEIFGMLDFLQYPSFCVKENQIIKVNPAARALPLQLGMDVRDLLATGKEEYAAFTGGCLYLALSFASKRQGATVLWMDGTHVFLLEPQAETMSLQALSLAAQALRKPLSDMAVVIHGMFAEPSHALADRAAALNRSLHQMLRLVNNMSDAQSIPDTYHPTLRNVGLVFQEIMDTVQLQLERMGVAFSYIPLSETVYSMADRDLLERAALNMLSNALKFTPADGCITAKLSKQGRMLRFSVEDSGAGISEDMLGTIFSRYLRSAGIEDSRFGIGLGMLIIRAAAARHGGTVLIDQPQGVGCRVTLTIAIQEGLAGLLHSPIQLPDYTGGRDHTLVELSECLPLSAYAKDK